MRLLSGCMTLVDAVSATDALMDRYGSIADAISAPFSDLQSVACLGDRGAILLSCIQEAAIRLCIPPLPKYGHVLRNWPALCAYLNVSLARAKEESVRVLFLNTKNRLIEDCIVSTGIPNFVYLPIRNMAYRALQLGATAVVIVHNHPSGDPTPSQGDLDMTKTIENVFKPLGILLNDHIIVGRGTYYSYRLKGLIQDL